MPEFNIGYALKLSVSVAEATLHYSGPCLGICMSIPTCGDLIANKFKLLRFFWSTYFSQSFFPHFCLPNGNPLIFKPGDNLWHLPEKCN
ncbi:hypothetical protein VP01_449g3 [Puccinia sorghi]|uniref:Uncharacterized protein n=1 Tax=Puccinia sorghi TaxID=27349 RepID=A0A0L6UPY8_9BASI|nr:hypothetical protein VP01_449g3 [Puccinia sorghi]